MAYSAKYTPRPRTDIFTSDTDINRRKLGRVVPMKVLILGLGRTGTACTFDHLARWHSRFLISSTTSQKHVSNHHVTNFIQLCERL